MYTEAKLRRLMMELRRDFPLEFPGRVRRVLLPGSAMGDCRMIYDKDHTPKYHLIRLNKRLPLICQRDTLLHEWAHAMVWHPGEIVHHRQSWALKYKRLLDWAGVYGQIIRWSQGENEYEVEQGCADYFGS